MTEGKTAPVSVTVQNGRNLLMRIVAALVLAPAAIALAYLGGWFWIALVTLAATTGLPIEDLSKWVGRLCAPVSLFIPAYLILVMGGFKELRRVWPAALVCGVSFSATQFGVSNYLGPYLTDILGSLAAVVAVMGWTIAVVSGVFVIVSVEVAVGVSGVEVLVLDAVTVGVAVAPCTVATITAISTKA